MSAAFPSPMVTGLQVIRFIRYSQMIADETAREMTPMAGMP